MQPIVAMCKFYNSSTNKLAVLIYQALLLLKNRSFIPQCIWNLISQISNMNGVTIRDVIDNFVLISIIPIFYQISHAFSQYIFAVMNIDIITTAVQNAEMIHTIELSLHIYIEESVQTFFVDSPSYLSYQSFFYIIYYACHGICTGCVYFFGFLFMSRKTKVWYLYLYTFWVSCIITIIIPSFFPCAPPRLTPNIGILDTFDDAFGRSTCTKEENYNGWLNCYAAMPSGHMIWCICTSICALYNLRILLFALDSNSNSNWDSTKSVLNNNQNNYNYNSSLIDYLAIEQSRKKYLRWIIYLLMIFFGLYQPLMIITIIAIGNHFVLDIVVSYAIIVMSYTIVHRTWLAK